MSGDLLSQIGSTPLGTILRHMTNGQTGAAGLDALVQRLRAAGLGQRVDSWISSGHNEPVAPQELERALGDREVDAMAREAGMDRGGLLALLAAVLPQLVDMLTPRGQTPRTDEELPGAPQHDLPGLLGGLFGGAGAGGLAGGIGSLLGQGSGAAGGLGALFGGAGGDAARHPGMGGSLSESPGRVGPTPIPEDDADPGLADRGSAHGPGPTRRE